MQDPIQVEQVAVDLTTFPNIEYDCGEDMVTRKTITIDLFVPRARQTAPQQPPQDRGQTPSPPPPLIIKSSKLCHNA